MVNPQFLGLYFFLPFIIIDITYLNGYNMVILTTYINLGGPFSKSYGHTSKAKVLPQNEGNKNLFFPRECYILIFLIIPKLFPLQIKNRY